MSDKYAALRAAAEGAFSSWSRNVTVPTKELLALLAEREADKARIAQLEAERDALREGEMGDAKHSNTRAAADIYFQLVEECNIPTGGSLVEYVDHLRDRIADLEARKVKLPKRSVAEVMHMSGFSRDYAEGWCSGNDNAIHEIRSAGITLETGE